MGNRTITKSILERDVAEDDINSVKKKDPLKVVIEKVLQNPVYREKLKDDESTLNRFATVLSTKSELKRTYLTTDWVETINLYKTLVEEDKKLSKKSTIQPKDDKGFSSKSESTVDDIPNNVDVHEEEDEEEEGLEPISHEDMEQAKLDSDLQLKHNVKIKILISEVANSSFRKNFRKLVSPVLSKLDVLPEFGMFHSALMIGPWLIEWNNSALCIPRKCVSRAALLTADIDTINTDKKIEEVVDTLADVIVEWNTTKEYKDRATNKEKEGNCQDFVVDILNRLNIKYEFKGALGTFLKKIREEGKCEMEFEMDFEFRQKFNIKEKKVKFNTHLELDKFVMDLMKIDLELELKYKHEWALLKSFDRAFWLRHYKFPTNDKWTPYKEDECKCPFGDPSETYSIRFV